MSFEALFLESFEHGQNDVLYDNTYLLADVIAGAKKNGAYGMELSGSNAYFRWDFSEFAITPLPSEIYIGTWINVPDDITSGGPCVWDGDGYRIHVEIRSDGKFEAYVNDVSVGVGSIVVTKTDWNHVQLRAIIADSGGKVQVRVNNVLDIDYTGDTKTGTTTNILAVGLYDGGNNERAYFDDVAIGQVDWPGELQAHVMRPVADYDQDWSISAGSDHYVLVDEVPADDADYIYSIVNDQEDSYDTTGDFDDTNKRIFAVVAKARMLADIGTENVALGVNSNGALSAATFQELPWGVYISMHTIIQDDPDTLSPWADEAAVNIAKLYMKSVIS